MNTILEMIMKGDDRPLAYFRSAKTYWEQFFDDLKDASTQEWADRLTRDQIAYFEHGVGDRWIGQEVMAWSGFTYLYSTTLGFDENLEKAKKLSHAFSNSGCSIETKGAARKAAEHYSVDD